MDRRKYLVISSSLAMTAIAGCSSGGESDEPSESGDGSETEDQDGESEKLAPPKLESHDVRRMAAGGMEVVVTMSNGTEKTLNRAYGEVDIYNDDTRLAEGRAAIIDLEPGITDNESALLEEFSPNDVTRYTITMSGETEDFEDTRSEEFEFEGEEFRSRLSE